MEGVDEGFGGPAVDRRAGSSLESGLAHQVGAPVLFYAEDDHRRDKGDGEGKTGL